MSDIDIGKLLRIDLSMGFTSYAPRILGWIIALTVVMWVVIGLISLRFDLTDGLENVFYTQLIAIAILTDILTNIFIIDAGGFGDKKPWRYLRYSPALSGLTTSAGLALLLIPIWAGFEDYSDNTLKLTFSLIGLGLCGSFAGVVSLAKVDRFYRPLIWVMNVLTIIVGVEIIDALWTVDTLSASEAGWDFVWIGVSVAVAIGAYSALAFVGVRYWKTARDRDRGMIIYLVAGLIGYAIGLLSLWDSLDAGARRFVYGAALLLAICSVALWLLRYFQENPPSEIQEAETPDTDEPQRLAQRMSADAQWLLRYFQQHRPMEIAEAHSTGMNQHHEQPQRNDIDAEVDPKDDE